MNSQFRPDLRRVCTLDEPFTLVTITRVKGFTPRKPGAKMLVLPDGEVCGTIGGGCGEAEVRREALDALNEKKPRKYQVNMTNDLAEEEGRFAGALWRFSLTYFQWVRAKKKQYWEPTWRAWATGKNRCLSH